MDEREQPEAEKSEEEMKVRSICVSSSFSQNLGSTGDWESLKG